MLRASANAVQQPADLAAATGHGDGNVPHGDHLVTFVNATMAGDRRAILDAQDALAMAAGPAAVGEAAAVIGNFEMMTRIADGTGARFPDGALGGLADIRNQFGLDGFVSAR